MLDQTTTQANPANGEASIGVMVVDDSATVRSVLRRRIEADPRCHLAGVARDGAEALRQVADLQPDVMTLDVEMPVMDGLATLRRLMAEHPLPVVMVSSLTREGAEATIEALELGAVDFFPKPMIGKTVTPHQIGDALIDQICAAAAVPRARLRPGASRSSAARAQRRTGRQRRGAADGRSGAGATGGRWRNRVVMIGASTGGPQALREVITALPADLHVPVVVVQHMPPGFTESLARRLDSLSAVEVAEARDGDRLQPGRVLLAPGGFHLVAGRLDRVTLNEDVEECGVRPAVNVTLESLVKQRGPDVVAVILTGMGVDGARSSALVRAVGGTVIAQNEATSVVYGMPRAIVEADLADEVLPLPDIAEAIERHCRLERGSARSA